MIKDIVSSGPFIQALGGGGYTPYINMSNPSAGMVRFHSNTQSLEIYDGTNWQVWNTSVANISLTSDAVSAIMWARDKMTEEASLKKLAEDHPAIQIALSNLEKAKQQLDATIILSKEHDKSS